MRKSVVWGLLLLILVGCGRNEYLNVMSFNIRLDSAQDGINQWENRKEMVRKVFSDQNIDIAGLQEVLQNQLNFLIKNLPEYQVYGVGRDDGKKGGEACPVLFRKERFELLESNTFWLSETPEKPGNLCWNTVCNRICSWVKLRDRKTKEVFYLFNTHLSHVSALAREKSVDILLSEIHKTAGDATVILTGDFNFQMTSKTYHNLLAGKQIKLNNSANMAGYSFRNEDHTYNGWGKGNYRPIIDHIFITKNVDAIDFKILVKKEDDIYISDHYPVITKIYN